MPHERRTENRPVPALAGVLRDGITVTVEISRIEDGNEWALEVIDTQGMSTRWEDLFATDAAALAEFLSAVEQDGMSVFVMPSALH